MIRLEGDTNFFKSGRLLRIKIVTSLCGIKFSPNYPFQLIPFYDLFENSTEAFTDGAS